MGRAFWAREINRSALGTRGLELSVTGSRLVARHVARAKSQGSKNEINRSFLNGIGFVSYSGSRNDRDAVGVFLLHAQRWQDHGRRERTKQAIRRVLQKERHSLHTGYPDTYACW